MILIIVTTDIFNIVECKIFLFICYEDFYPYLITGKDGEEKYRQYEKKIKAEKLGASFLYSIEFYFFH